MASTSSKMSHSDEGDVFDDPLMRIVLVILLLFMLISAIGLGVVYWDDSIAVPSLNERSVPPPILY